MNRMIMIDMKMPRCCIGCPILRDHYGWEAFCPFVCEENNINIKYRTDRPNDCPLKEIEESDDCVKRSSITEILNKMDRYKELCEDAISRRDMALNIISFYNKATGKKKTLDFLCKCVEGLPSVLPEQTRWIPVSERLPNNHEYIKNKGLFNVSDGNRSYFEWFDFYNTKRFVEPTIAGFRVDNAVTAWMPLPEPYKAESEKARAENAIKS